MPYDAYAALKAEHSKRLDLIIGQFAQAMNEDAYEALERSGASNALIDAVAERHVLRAFGNRTHSIEDGIKALDAFTVVFVESAGPLSDVYMRGRVNTWIQGWRRRLEKLQRENPNV
ncbi:hypothetical protein MARCHEWKA_03190 [Brevundimonas phage vB_BpoS-Marchewka]|uniref:Uncharacterized protein n=1 Tax=Brevundimonas phage vB_BpoS-Marchewka TaxID=2948604 RepID=A0A9E7N5Z6_9CAUD|nr:hypothetical protein MARCHEWKA_03190 [Brevundimonas phage vB_BpoS-Marchewka]UTC29278.1 hypothetical protein BAMBUS_01960 [Brevundimonas phage vB_BpoS-Bambus]